MVGWMTSNPWSSLFVLLIQCLILYQKVYTKSNFNILYTDMLIFYVAIVWEDQDSNSDIINQL